MEFSKEKKLQCFQSVRPESLKSILAFQGAGRQHCKTASAVVAFVPCTSDAGGNMLDETKNNPRICRNLVGTALYLLVVPFGSIDIQGCLVGSKSMVSFDKKAIVAGDGLETQ